MTNNTESNQNKGNFVADLYDWLDSIVVAVVTVILLFTFVFRVVGIKGPSMKNTLFEGDRIVISNLFYTPTVGDVIVISRNYNGEYTSETSASEPIIKRVIATAGMTVDIDFDIGVVYVDGKPLDEPYTRTATYQKWDVDFPLTVGENEIFVMGDNRQESLDSRDTRIGMIDTRYVLGKALFRIYRDELYRTSKYDFVGGIA